jgi:hypothetical protein
MSMAGMECCCGLATFDTQRKEKRNSSDVRMADVGR